MSVALGGTALVTALLLTARAVRPRHTRGKNDPSARVSRHRSTRPSATDWAAFLDTTSAEVRGGTSLVAALTHARVRHPALANRLDTAAAHDDRDLSIVTQSINAAMELGGPVAATLHHAAALLRERAAQRAEAAAHSAQARLSAKVLTAVPIAFAVWSAATSATFRDAITSPTGVIAASAGLATNALGWWWMRRIVDKATP